MPLAGAFGRCLWSVPLAVAIVCIVCRFPYADYVRVLLCGFCCADFALRILLCGFRYGDCAVGVAQWGLCSEDCILLWALLCWLHRCADCIVRILSCGFHLRADSIIVRIPSSCKFPNSTVVQILSLCGFHHRVDSILVRIPSSSGFHHMDSHCADFIVRIPIVWIPLCGFYHADSIVQIVSV